MSHSLTNTLETLVLQKIYSLLSYTNQTAKLTRIQKSKGKTFVKAFFCELFEALHAVQRWFLVYT